MDTTSHLWQMIMEGLRNMPAAQTVLLVLFMFVAVVGGNGVVALHYRRVGKPVLKSILDPRSFPIADFNGREWLMLAGCSPCRGSSSSARRMRARPSASDISPRPDPQSRYSTS